MSETLVKEETIKETIMNEKVKECLQNYANGYTCSQAVFCSYADKMGISKETAYRMVEAFGGGFGGMQEVCGALSAAFAIISYHYSNGTLGDGHSRKESFAKIREAAKLFEDEFDAIRCIDVMKGEKPKPFKCGKKVKVAAEIVNKLLGDE